MKTPVWVVRAVQPHEDYRLLITFADGSRKTFDTRPLLKKPIYERLQELAFFMRAKVECGTVVWNDEIDIAPEFLYENGVSVLIQE